MAHRKILVGMTCFLVVLAAMLGLAMDVMSISDASATVEKARPGLVLVDAIAEKQQLEMPAAVFLHDRHTQALEEKGKDCAACHKEVTTSQGQKALAFSFERTEEESKSMSAEELKELYHSKCISCHAEDKAARAEKFGPQAGECRTCHVESPEYTAARKPVAMGNALHYRHWGSENIPKDKGLDTNCGACHHEYDKAEKKLVYVQYQEESCSYCHTEDPAESPAVAPEEGMKLDTMDAFHAQCVNCHRDLQKVGVEKTGPVDCAGCHGAVAQDEVRDENKAMIEKLDGTLPRLPRKQPDAALLLPTVDAKAPAVAQESKAGVMPVAFDHKAHEQSVESCATCHHKSVQACSTCHTLGGKEEGGFVTIEQAMHQVDSDKSCIGCHAEQKAKPECAACHATMKVTPQPAADSCSSCHIEPQAPAEQPAATTDEEGASEEAPAMTLEKPLLPLPLPESKEARQALAQKIVDMRSDEQKLIDVKDIPEKVVIGSLADQYKPSEMPHRQIVLKLAENIKNDSLAGAFHATSTTLCQGCHHNSPASATPPSCKSCHSKPFEEGRLGRPGLKAAYHGQCMDCHTALGLEKPANTDCTACHAKSDNG